MQPSTSVSGASLPAEQALEIAVGCRQRDGRIGPALLGEGHEHLTGLLHHDRVAHQPVNGPRIGAAFDRALGRDHGDAAVAGGRGARAGAGLDHADHRHRLPCLLQQIERHGRGRVAGDHQHLDALIDQEPCRLERIGLNRLGALGAVREPRGVAEIDEMLVGEARDERPQHRKPAHSGVEHPDRPGITRHRRPRTS